MAWIWWALLALAAFISGALFTARTKKKGFLAISGISLVMLVALMVILGLSLPYDSIGANAPISMSPLQMMESNASSPVNDQNPDISPGNIVVLYRYGCEDCERTYKELSELLGPDVQWVSSRSATGKQLVDTYDVITVPTGLYFRKSSSGNEPNVISVTLYEGDDDNNAIVNYDEVNRLLDAKEKEL